MADEVDPLEALVNAHVARIQEIADEGFAQSKQLCNDTVQAVRRQAGFKSTILDRALAALGIADPESPKADQ